MRRCENSTSNQTISIIEDAVRHTTDVNAGPILKQMSHLSVRQTPAILAGDWRYVTASARAAVAAGVDGLLAAVHPDTQHARSDAKHKP